MVVSDVHLTEVVETADEGWWTYKRPAAAQDHVLVGFLRFLEEQRPVGIDATHLVLNGDTWDFDSVYSGPEGIEVPPEGMPLDVPGSVYKMRRMIADHPEIVAGLARFAAAGNRVTFVMGNHDRELAFPEVQETLRQAIVRASTAGSGVAVADAIAFEPWFFHVPGVLYAEHGQQYDATCAYRDVLDPLVAADRRRPIELEASLGSVVGRRVLPRMGTFNPYEDDSFLMSLGGYARHAVTYYWPRRPFFSVYVVAAARSYRELRDRRRRALRAAVSSERRYERYERYAAAQGVPTDFVAMLRRLSSLPIQDRVGELLHELWIDRFIALFAALLILGVGIAHAESWREGLLLLSLVPVFGLVFRMLGRGSLALQERGRWGLVAEHVAVGLGVPIVAFGHSHRPERRPLRNGGRYYNLGTWAPVLEHDHDPALVRARRFLVVRRGPAGRLYVAFQRWGADGIAPF